jgi:hypothetical protein
MFQSILAYLKRNQDELFISLAILSGIMSIYTMHSNIASGFGYVAILFICLISANIDRIAEFKISATNIEAKLKETIKEAENSIEGLNDLVVALVDSYSALLASYGFLNSMDNKERHNYKLSLGVALKKMNLASREHEAFCGWNKTMLKIYTNLVLQNFIQGHDFIDTIPGDILKKMKTMKERGFLNPPTYSEVETLVFATEIKNDNLKEALADLKYYEDHLEHRRPERFLSTPGDA